MRYLSSRTVPDHARMMGIVMWGMLVAPCLKVKYIYRLNSLSSSYTTEAIAILKAVSLVLLLAEKWTSINICSDSLSLLMKLKADLSSIFPFVKSNLILP